MAASIRVRGVTYSKPDEAYVAAAELEDHAEQLARDLRFDGKDAAAEQVTDRARADAERLRAWARGHEAAAAGETPQPADTPRPAKPRRSASRPKPRATRRRGSSSSGAGRLTPRARSIVRQTRIPAATSSATGLALQAAGLTLGVAFLTLLLTDRGVSAFGDLAGGAANGLRWIVDPTDPLAPRPKPAAAPASRAAGAARAAVRPPVPVGGPR